MKDLTYKEFLQAPVRVQFLYAMAIAKQPVGSKIIKDAIKETPEYFLDELEQIKAFLLGWSLAVIIFCTLFAFVIGIERDCYNKRIEVLQKKCK